jgi:mannose-6-phosphate isomerase
LKGRAAVISKISNSARDYAWGSKTLIADFFGLPATGGPMAEVWFGTHSGSPTLLADEPNRTVLAALDNHPLSYLLKILAADQPLSIQAHPNSMQALEGFARENAAGVPIESPSRNYRDDRHKPEMVVALIDGFEALCGFRAIDETIALFKSFGPSMAVYVEALEKTDGLRQAFNLAFASKGSLGKLTAELASKSKLAQRLEALYPGDPGIIVALMMNHVVLAAGEGLYLPAGNIHAYLYGLGVEIMAASDNVLRGGLTPKHVDVQELQTVVKFESIVAQPVQPKPILTGLTRYEADCPDFALYRIDVTGSTVLADLKISTHSILLCTGGEVSISDSLGEHVVVRRGEAALITSDAKFVSLAGNGNAFLAC